MRCSDMLVLLKILFNASCIHQSLLSQNGYLAPMINGKDSALIRLKGPYLLGRRHGSLHGRTKHGAGDAACTCITACRAGLQHLRQAPCTSSVGRCWRCQRSERHWLRCILRRSCCCCRCSCCWSSRSSLTYSAGSSLLTAAWLSSGGCWLCCRLLCTLPRASCSSL